MVTGFDYLSHDQALQSHWLRRFVAIVIDSVIIWFPLWLVLAVFGIPTIVPGAIFGPLLFLYSTFFELRIGGTIGKMLMHLKAVPVSGHMDSTKAFMRNVSKIFPLLLLLDWIVGMVMDTTDPRQKWTDRLAGTSVIIVDHPGGT